MKTKISVGSLFAVTLLFQTAGFADTVSAENRIHFDGQWITINKSEPVSSEATETSNALRVTEFPNERVLDNLCVQPKVTDDSQNCCSYDIYNSSKKANERYEQPHHAFSTDTAAQNFVLSVQAKMPFFVPYTDSRVSQVAGWFYDNGGLHAAADFLKWPLNSGEDPTFPVLAVAPGKVVSVYWDNWLGNTVIIEHTAANGSKYRTIYNHVRNGFTHDLTNARAIDVSKIANTPDNANWFKYKKFAELPNPNPLHWGTNSQTILVKAGDSVYQGQQVAWSGDTGAGGAGNGLQADGTPYNAQTANNHLHLFFAVPNPNDMSKWVFVDGFGVYGQVNSGCYALLKNTAGERLFAAFYPSFHNIDSAIFNKYFGYYPGMGMGMQTVSPHLFSSQLLVSGSFQTDVASSWLMRYYLTGTEFQQAFNTYNQQGMRPREVSATIDTSGNPRFNAIWQKKGSSEIEYTYFGDDDAAYQQRFNTLTTQGFRVEDHFAYNDHGTRRHIAVFVKDGQGAYAIYGYQSSDYQNFFNKVFKEGYRPTSIQVEDGEKVGGVFMKKPGYWEAFYGMTPDVYQQKFNTYKAQGYRLWKIQGYDNASEISAIWTK